jgi:hypothetical protein
MQRLSKTGFKAKKNTVIVDCPFRISGDFFACLIWEFRVRFKKGLYSLAIGLYCNIIKTT